VTPGGRIAVGVMALFFLAATLIAVMIDAGIIGR
jgi:hypothetical protein